MWSDSLTLYVFPQDTEYIKDNRHYDEPNLQGTSPPSKHGSSREIKLDPSTQGPLHHTLHLEITTEKEPGAQARNICNVPQETEDQMQCVIKELETTVNTRVFNGQNAGEPFYYVLEGPLPSPESNRDAMHSVIKELESLNVNSPKRETSDDFTTEPLYNVLESSEDTENKSSREETIPQL